MSQVGVHGTLRHLYGLGAESTPIIIIVVIALGLMTDGDLWPAFTAIIIIIISISVAVVILIVVVLIVTVVIVPV